MGNSKFFTKTLTNGQSFTVSEDNGISQVSIIVLSGTCTLQGNYRLGAENSSTITLLSGVATTIPAKGPDAPIDGLTITSSGEVGIILIP